MEILSMLAQNLKYLRTKSGKSQEELAKELGINRTTWAHYENGSSDPPAMLVKKVAELYSLTADDLLNADLGAPLFRGTHKMANLRNPHVRVLTLTVDNHKRDNIDFVSIMATAGYSVEHGNTEFIQELPHFQLPKLNEGKFRAFEITGDSMLPIQAGSVIVGRYIESWKEIQNGKRYVLALQDQGVVFKRVFNEVSLNNKLILASDNPNFQAFTVSLENVLEAWEMVAYIVYADQDVSDYSFILQKLGVLEQQIMQLTA